MSQGTAAVQDVLDELLSYAAAHRLEGITFSGGEPLQQAEDMALLTAGLRSVAPDLSLGLYTGYTEEELESGHFHTRASSFPEERRALWQSIRECLDFAVMGRYNRMRPSMQPLCTSANQVLKIFGPRYSTADFCPQAIEVTISASGRATLTGFPTLGLPL